MEFEWDENKNKRNIIKHQIAFDDAKEVFKDINRKVSPDLRFDYGESRWVTIGKMLDAIIVVVYTCRNKVYRLISARYAKKQEREIYNN